MHGTLVLTILAVQSSYLQEVEQPLRDGGGASDTIQWWIAPTGSWRIRTYALDHDIHTHSIGNADGLIELVLINTRKHYGDVIRSQHVIELIDCLDKEATTAAFQAAGLEPGLRLQQDDLHSGSQTTGATTRNPSRSNDVCLRSWFPGKRKHPTAKPR